MRLTEIVLCRKQHAEIGFIRFKNNDFDDELKECPGTLKKSEDEELAALLRADLCQAQV